MLVSVCSAAWNGFKRKDTWICLAVALCWVSDEKDGSALNRGRSEEKGVELRTRSLELRGQDAEWDSEETQKAAGGSMNGEQWALGRDSEGRQVTQQGFPVPTGGQAANGAAHALLQKHILGT